MRTFVFVAAVALCALLGPAAHAQTNAFSVPSSIEGRVVGPDGKGVERAIVRLLDDSGVREAGRTYTDTSGRYRLTTTAGTYVVEVQPQQNPDFASQRQEVQIIVGPNSRGGERTFLNFFLKPVAAVVATSRGPRFDQEVPPEAEREYQSGVKLLATDKEAGYKSLRNAIQAYPDYYLALETLGTAYAKDNFLDEALVLLQHAVEVNPKGERSQYALGVIYYKKGRFDLATEAFKRADAIVPEDPNTLMYLGLAQVRNKQNAEAEQTLKLAYSKGAKNVPELHMALAQVYINDKRYKEAAAELRTLLKETPNLKDKDKIQGLIDKYDKM
jgi:tetratricopeptide (TPR) repeat protein